MKSVKKGKGIVIFLNIAALITILVVAANMVVNYILFKAAVKQYIDQGYAAAEVTKQLLTSTLLPAILESLAFVSVGIFLFVAGIIYKKVSECLALLNKDQECIEPAEESIPVENMIDTEVNNDNNA